MLRAFVPGLAFCVLVSSEAFAQENKPSPRPSNTPQSNTEAVPSPSLANTPHSEILLHFRNGDKVKGIVRNNRYTEKAQGKDFIACQTQDQGSGMRLWFVNDTKSYVFYPQHKIQKHTLLRRLSDLEFREIATRVENLANLKKEQALEEKKAEEMRSEAASLAKEKSTEVAKKEPEPGLAKPNLTPEQIEEQQKQEQEMAEGKALLERFAPEAGWGQAKIEAIRKRRVNDVYPTKEEAEFEKGYALWKKAYDVMLEEQRLAELEAQKNAERAVNAPREN